MATERIKFRKGSQDNSERLLFTCLGNYKNYERDDVNDRRRDGNPTQGRGQGRFARDSKNEDSYDRRRRNPGDQNYHKRDIREVECYNCHEFGHYARDCPKPNCRREISNLVEEDGRRFRTNIIDGYISRRNQLKRKFCNKSSDEADEDDTADEAAGETPLQKLASENEQALKNVLDKLMDKERRLKSNQMMLEKSLKHNVTCSIFQGSLLEQAALTAFLAVSAYDDDDFYTCNSPYADQVVVAEADFNNMEFSTIVSPIPTTRVHSIHPKDQIIGDPRSIVQTRGITKKSSREHAMISYIQKQRRHAMYYPVGEDFILPDENKWNTKIGQCDGYLTQQRVNKRGIRNSESIQRVFAIASEKIPPKTKTSKKKVDSDAPTKIPVLMLYLDIMLKLPLYFDYRLKALEDNFSEFRQTNQYADALSSIPGIVDHYLANKMQEAVDVAVQLKYDRIREESHTKNQQFLDSIDEGMKKVIKEQVKKEVSKITPKIEKLVNEQLESEVLVRSSKEAKTSHAVAANLLELELKKILIDKMEANNSINRSDIQRQLYKALVDAYEADKILLDTYGDTVIIKRPRDGADDDQEPSAGTDRGSKRRRSEKEPESTSAPRETTEEY
ncbi:reverse transcriptase domain-containing protein [Tanacetum coccineum]|uniref:Reverse transcriptase domain-containing protein n=1 Tax=Tanacetum coccineum TaxID=301880 RepID=A0ABQ5GZW6_9ASTR